MSSTHRPAGDAAVLGDRPIPTEQYGAGDVLATETSCRSLRGVARSSGGVVGGGITGKICGGSPQQDGGRRCVSLREAGRGCSGGADDYTSAAAATATAYRGRGGVQARSHRRDVDACGVAASQPPRNGQC